MYTLKVYTTSPYFRSCDHKYHLKQSRFVFRILLIKAYNSINGLSSYFNPLHACSLLPPTILPSHNILPSHTVGGAFSLLQQAFHSHQDLLGDVQALVM